jgi:hypothetical protein
MAPHLVKSCFTFTEEGLDPILIGGMDGQSQSRLSLTTIITFYPPYKVNGRAATMSDGLAEETATNTILSHPFLRTMRAHIDYEHNAIILNNTGAKLTPHTIGAKLTMFHHIPMKSEACLTNKVQYLRNLNSQFERTTKYHTTHETQTINKEY